MCDEYIEKYPNVYKFLSNDFACDELLDILSNLNGTLEYSFAEDILNDGGEYLLMDKFKNSYKECYGSEFLIDNFDDLSSSILNRGLRNERVKDVIKTLNKYDIPINTSVYCFLDSSKVDKKYIETIAPLFNDFRIKRFIFEALNFDEYDFEFLEKAVLEDSYENKILKFIVSKYSVFEQSNYKYLIDIEDKENLYKFIKLMPDEYFNNNSKIKRVVKKYFDLEELITNINLDDIEYDEVKCNFKTYIMDQNRNDFSIKTKKDLMNIKDIRYDYYFGKINKCEDIYKIKSYVSQYAYNMRYSEFYDKVLEIQDLSIKTQKISEKEWDEYSVVSELCHIDTKKGLLNYYDKFRYFCSFENIPTFFERIEPRIKEIYQECLVSSLTKLPKGRGVIRYTGEEMSFFVHKIAGLGNRGMAEKIYNNPTIWKEKTKGFLDVSLIDEEYMGVAPGNGFIFIFNDIKPHELVAMGKEDIYTDYNNVVGSVNNLKEKWMLKDDLRKVTVGPFDNHAIKRKDGSEGIPFMPSGVLCFDEISYKDIEVSEMYDIPIVLIDRECYAIGQQEKIDKALERKDSDEYYRLKIQMFMSLRDNKKLVNKYFNDEVFENDLKNLISSINPNKSYDLKMLSTMLKVNYDIASSIYSMDSSLYSEKDVTRILKKK